MRRTVPWKPLALVTTTTTLLLGLLLLPACCCRGTQVAPAAAPAPPRISPLGAADIPIPTMATAHAPTETQFHNVRFHLSDDVALEIHTLRGTIASKEAGQPVNLDNKLTFVQHVDHGVVGVRAPILETVMNRYVFGYEGAPLRNVRVAYDGGHLVLEGVMRKIVELPFTMHADVASTPQGWLRIRPTKVSICGVNGLALMKAVGQSLQSMLDLSKAKGVRAEGNDLFVDPLAVLPPPLVTGHIAAAKVEGEELVLRFDSPNEKPELTTTDAAAKNYMYFKGGTLRMGKLLMVDADMLVEDLDPGDPFDFAIEDYNTQLVAGSSHNLPDYGLIVRMKDWNKLPR